MEVITADNFVKNLSKIKEVLLSGGLVIFPTETCYGIACLATSSKGVDKLLKYKKRPAGKPISIAVDSIKMADRYVVLNATAKRIYETFLPGPVTVVSESKKKIDVRLENEDGNLGVRIPSNQLVLDIINLIDAPITSTSANVSGKKTPYCLEDILDNTTEKQKGLIDIFLDLGELAKNPPSTVVDTTKEDLLTYREGSIDVRNSKLHVSKSVEETIAFGQNFISEVLESNNLEIKAIVIFLNANMGAGKTHFVKGIAKALGINQMIKSPTYNYFEEYSFGKDQRSMLIHVDAWRIASLEDLRFLSLERYFLPNRIIAIEWPSIITTLDPNLFSEFNIIKVFIDIVNENTRKFFYNI